MECKNTLLFSTLSVAWDERAGFLGLVLLDLLGLVVFGTIDFEKGREMNEVEMLEEKQASEGRKRRGSF